MQNTTNFTLVANYSGFFAEYKYNVTGDYTLIIGGFSPDNYTPAMDALYNALDIVRNDTKAKLFINIASNPGGDPEISAMLAHAIDPNHFPYYPRMVLRHSKLADMLYRTSVPLNQYRMFDYLSGK